MLTSVPDIGMQPVIHHRTYAHVKMDDVLPHVDG